MELSTHMGLTLSMDVHVPTGLGPETSLLVASRCSSPCTLPFCSRGVWSFLLCEEEVLQEGRIVTLAVECCGHWANLNATWVVGLAGLGYRGGNRLSHMVMSEGALLPSLAARGPPSTRKPLLPFPCSSVTCAIDRATHSSGPGWGIPPCSLHSSFPELTGPFWWEHWSSAWVGGWAWGPGLARLFQSLAFLDRAKQMAGP